MAQGQHHTGTKHNTCSTAPRGLSPESHFLVSLTRCFRFPKWRPTEQSSLRRHHFLQPSLRRMWTKWFHLLLGKLAQGEEINHQPTSGPLEAIYHLEFPSVLNQASTPGGAPPPKTLYFKTFSSTIFLLMICKASSIFKTLRG